LLFLTGKLLAASLFSSSPPAHWKSPEADLTKLVAVMLFSEQSSASSEKMPGTVKQGDVDGLKKNKNKKAVSCEGQEAPQRSRM
jgi:hypothetical protein